MALFTVVLLQVVCELRLMGFALARDLGKGDDTRQRWVLLTGQIISYRP